MVSLIYSTLGPRPAVHIRLLCIDLAAVEAQTYQQMDGISDIYKSNLIYNLQMEFYMTTYNQINTFELAVKVQMHSIGGKSIATYYDRQDRTVQTIIYDAKDRMIAFVEVQYNNQGEHVQFALYTASQPAADLSQYDDDYFDASTHLIVRTSKDADYYVNTLFSQFQ